MTQIRKKRLAEEVIKEIKRMIRDGELDDGDKLPNQIEFASQLGVSRTSLREALNMLSMVGAVEQKQGAGTLLVSKYKALSIHSFAPPLMSDSNAAFELIEARKIVEVGAAELAAVNATPKQIEKLENIVSSMKISLESGNSQYYIDLDMKYHLNIAQCSNNRFIIYSYQNMQGYIEQYIQECLNILPNMQKTSMEFHRRIFEAIKDHDKKRSVREMQKHIFDIQKMYEQYYRNHH
jgi:GntR family transcriptional repressor for pyruvate dehydrogenase complex